LLKLLFQELDSGVVIPFWANL